MALSSKTEEIIEKKDKKKYLPSAEELKAIKAQKLEDKEALRLKRIETIRKAINSQGVRLKTKAKGPNPLSVKKKKESD